MKNLKSIAVSLLSLILFIPYGYLSARESVKIDLVGSYNGRDVHLFTLINKSNNVLKITNYGARIVRIEVSDRNRVKENGKSPAVKLSYKSPDMEEGFPGNVLIEVIYTWTDKNETGIDYKATTDKKTVLNVTNHAYFNLRGAGNGNIFDHIMFINSSSFTPFNFVKIPTGEIRSVKGTPFDFTSPRKIGEKIGETYENAVFDGYDHNFVLTNKKKVDASVYEPESGRLMEIITDQPGLQFYSGSGIAWKKSLTLGTKPSNTRSGFALETQHYPDSPNHPEFPSTILEPGKSFNSRTIYRFSIRFK